MEKKKGKTRTNQYKTLSNKDESPGNISRAILLMKNVLLRFVQCPLNAFLHRFSFAWMTMMPYLSG